MSLLGLVAFGTHNQLHSNKFIQAVNWLALTIFQTQFILIFVFVAAVLAHVCEALYAMHLSRKIGCKSTVTAWGLQTLLLGYPSLRLLQKRQKVLNR